MKRRIAFLDVFSERPLAGNGLAVVDEADGVADDVMLAFALETRLSETTYVQTASAEGADYRNRIWTPGEEVPFAGHPSLGTAVAVARWRGEREASFVQETGAGLQPLEVRREENGGGERWDASMQQAEAAFGAEIDAAEAMASVGLERGDAHPDRPPQFVSTGVANAIVPLASDGALARVEPDYEAIDALLSPHDALVLYLAWCGTVSDGRAEVRARGFGRVAAMGEDPATGSAVGPLCAYLDRRAGCRAIEVSQGAELGRPSALHAEIDAEGRARVSGSVVPLIDGSVELPA
ncbi:MAG TPA: PhzF family phenazine biosynthesis protein [Solirubrobacterales bacterium]|nr:PhzF family phenazine biosynthesis protein [Solirubrobacterales bacterium]